MIMAFTFKKAVRKTVPMLMSVSGTSGSGKTYSALLLAAGIAGPDGLVFFGDTENGRGEMYVDSPGIVAALPNSFQYCRMDPPFSPEAHMDLISSAESQGASVLVIDSQTHEWEGIGGCCEIAEKNKLRGMPNWSKAKMAHKRMMNALLSTNMHVIFCLRAREKIKIVKDAQGKDQIIPLGIVPIQEKNFVFEMLVSLQLDESTHNAYPLKAPEPLQPLFPGGRLITKADGEHIRQWNETGSAGDPMEAVRKRARAAAEDGMAAYQAFFAELGVAEKKAIVGHADNKAIAEQADRDRVVEEEPVTEGA